MPFRCNEAVYQQFYSAASFDAPIEILSMAFRLNGNSYGRYLFDYDAVRITLSTAATDMAAPGLTLEGNLGADALVVHDAPYQEWIDGEGAGRQMFRLVFNFDQPFAYDPSAGDLLMQISLDYGSMLTTTAYLDYGFDPAFTRVARFVQGGVQAKVGLGIVTRFSDRHGVPNVPVPAAGPMAGALLLGAVGLTLGHRRRSGKAAIGRPGSGSFHTTGPRR